jgi:hypothetical protein
MLILPLFVDRELTLIFNVYCCDDVFTPPIRRGGRLHSILDSNLGMLGLVIWKLPNETRSDFRNPRTFADSSPC